MEKVDIVLLELENQIKHITCFIILTLKILRASARAPTASFKENMMLIDFSSSLISGDLRILCQW